jgi:hypothetical protein
MAATPRLVYRIGITASAVLLAAAAGNQANAGPPYMTDDPEPVEYQHFEFYTLSTGTMVRGDTGGVAPGFEFNYGLVPEGQVHIIAPFTFDAPSGGAAQWGYGDTELGFKYRFIDEDPHGARPMVGVYPLVELPSGDEGRALGAGYVRAYFPIWIQKSFGDWTTYGGGGYWINHGDGTANRDYVYVGWLLQRQVTKQLAIGGEIFHQTATVSFGNTDPAYTRPTTGFNIGAIYDIDEHHHLLASAGTGLQNAATTNQFSWYIAYQLTGSLGAEERAAGRGDHGK